MRERFETGDFGALVADTCGLLPQGGSLLYDLLEIPTLANSVNRLLNLLEIPTLGPPATRASYASAVNSNARTVRSSCERCERELARVLGALDAMP